MQLHASVGAQQLRVWRPIYTLSNARTHMSAEVLFITPEHRSARQDTVASDCAPAIVESLKQLECATCLCPVVIRPMPSGLVHV